MNYNNKNKNLCKKWELVNFCEFDKYAEKSYCAIHNVDSSKNLGDINKIDEHKLTPFNMICGGSPCQDFSVSGRQKGSVWTCIDCNHEYNPLTVHWSKRDKCPHCGSTNLEKTRSSLLVEYLRVIRANKPNFGIYENVKNIVGKQFKETTFKLFTEELEEYGYNVYWKVLNSKDFGIPQNRERVYLIFIKKELDNGLFKFLDSINTKTCLDDVLEDNVDEKYYISEEKIKKFIKKFHTHKANALMTQDMNQQAHRIMSIVSNYGEIFEKETDVASTLMARDYKGFGKQRTNAVVEIPQAANKIICASRGRDPQNLSDCNPGSHTEQRLEFNYEDCTNTLTSVQKDNYVFEFDNIKLRKLTPRECFRLMGFSDDAFEAAEKVVSNTQLYKQAGNSIVVDVLYYIFVELYKAMPYLFDDLKLSSFFSGIGAFECGLDRLYEDINLGIL